MLAAAKLSDELRRSTAEYAKVISKDICDSFTPPRRSTGRRSGVMQKTMLQLFKTVFLRWFALKCEYCGAVLELCGGAFANGEDRFVFYGVKK